MKIEQSEIKVFLDSADLQAMYDTALILDDIYNGMPDSGFINEYSREDIRKAKSVLTSLYFGAKKDDGQRITISCKSSCLNYIEGGEND